MKSRNVLVTGGAGFIGSYLVARLLEEGCTVFVVIRPGSDVWRINELLQNNRLRMCSNTAEEMRAVFSQHSIDCVLHLATKYIKQHQTIEDAQELLLSNVVFPSIILELMRQHDVRLIINAGTFFEYDLSGNKELSELSSIKPYNFYSRTKLMFNDLVRDYVDWFGFKAVNLRLFAPYGPKDNDKLIGYIIKNFLEKKSIHLTRSEQRWNFTCVTDIAEAFIKAVTYCESMESSYEVFNIGQTEATSISSIVKTLERQLAVSGLVSYDKPYPSNEIFYVSCDNKKSSEKLGWKPLVRIEEGLQKTVDFYSKKFFK